MHASTLSISFVVCAVTDRLPASTRASLRRNTAVRCYSLDNSCRNAPDNNIGRNIFSHHRSGCDDRIVAAYILAKYYRGGVSVLAVFGRQTVVQRGEHDVVPNLASVAKADASMILKMAAGIDEDILPDGDVLAEIRIEWREDAQCRVPGRSSHSP